MITDLSISHYKSITDQSTSLSPVNVLVGKNGSGKSNVVDALAFLGDIANDDLDYAITRRHGIDSIRQWSKFRPFHIAIQVKIERPEGKGFYKIVLSSSRNSYRIIEELFEWTGELTYSDDHCITVIKRTANNVLEIETDYQDEDIDFLNLSQIRTDSTTALLSAFTGRLYPLGWLVDYINQELRSIATFNIFPNTIRAPQTVSKGVALEADGRNIASIIKQLPSDRRKQIVKSLRVVLPQIDNISVRSTAGFYVPVLMVRSLGYEGSHELNMSQVSDGTLRILGILTGLFQVNSPSKIILEEPEQMIHPALLAVIRDAILAFVRRNESSQVFITTHSAVLLDLFDVENIIAVEYCDGATRVGPVSRRQKKVVKSGLMTLGDVLLAEDLEIE